MHIYRGYADLGRQIHGIKGDEGCQTQFEHKSGYPVVKRRRYIVHSPDEMKVDQGGEK